MHRFKSTGFSFIVLHRNSLYCSMICFSLNSNFIPSLLDTVLFSVIAVVNCCSQFIKKLYSPYEGFTIRCLHTSYFTCHTSYSQKNTVIKISRSPFSLCSHVNSLIVTWFPHYLGSSRSSFKKWPIIPRNTPFAWHERDFILLQIVLRHHAPA